ncbi:MAG: hypothetical protein ABI681_06895 [Gemmatimonadales bacterium]
MARRSRVWLLAGFVFVVVNVGGLVYAVAMGEPGHAATHAGVLLAGFFGWQLFGPRRSRPEESVISAGSVAFSDSLTHLEQSVEAVAIEVERIGEAQRFMTRVLSENAVPGAVGEGVAEPIELKAAEAVTQVRRD